MLKVGDRVEINDWNIQDTGTVQFFIPGELFPYQIKCDNGDEDGHKTLRFKGEVLTLIEGDKKAAEKQPGPLNEKLIVVEVVERKQSFQVGQQYYAEKRKTHYFLYNADKKFRGCMPMTMFKIIEPYREIKPIDIFKKVSNTNTPKEVKMRNSKREAAKKKTAEIIEKTIKERNIKKAGSTFEKMELLGQLNIFDILEG